MRTYQDYLEDCLKFGQKEPLSEEEFNDQLQDIMEAM